MFIEVVEVTEENKGRYSQLTVAYRKDGKLEEKKLMSFGGSAPSFNVLRSAVKGDQFNITNQKNEKGFWEWTEASRGTAPASPAAKPAGASPAPRNTYETPEERARRQVLIVRQSSLSSAVAFFNNKKSATPDEVVDLARHFENYVFGVGDVTSDPIAEMQDDIPF